jgi:hypothetical protein
MQCVSTNLPMYIVAPAKENKLENYVYMILCNAFQLHLLISIHKHLRNTDTAINIDNKNGVSIN